MNMKTWFQRSFVLLPLFVAACSAESKAPPPAVASPEAQRLVLAADPGDAKSVMDAKLATANSDVVVVGRIADVVKGKVALTLMDTEIPYCGEKSPEDHCKTPWDYCCESKERRAANSLFVEVRGADGKTLSSPGLPDLRLLDKVKVKGKIEVDPKGNHVLLANGVFRVDRPKLADGLKWPQ